MPTCLRKALAVLLIPAMLQEAGLTAVPSLSSLVSCPGFSTTRDLRPGTRDYFFSQALAAKSLSGLKTIYYFRIGDMFAAFAPLLRKARPPMPGLPYGFEFALAEGPEGWQSTEEESEKPRPILSSRLNGKNGFLPFTLPLLPRDIHTAERKLGITLDDRISTYGLLPVPFLFQAQIFKKYINPDNQDHFVALLAGEPAPIAHALLSSNADRCFIVNPIYERMTPEDLEEFFKNYPEREARQIKEDHRYREEKYRTGVGSVDPDSKRSLFNAIAKELRALGVHPEDVEVSGSRGCVEICFKWAYDNEKPKERVVDGKTVRELKLYKITFVGEDLKNLEKAPITQRVLKKGINLFYLRGGADLQAHYETFLLEVAKSLKLRNGHFLTEDYGFKNLGLQDWGSAFRRIARTVRIPKLKHVIDWLVWYQKSHLNWNGLSRATAKWAIIDERLRNRTRQSYELEARKGVHMILRRPISPRKNGARRVMAAALIAALTLLASPTWAQRLPGEMAHMLPAPFQQIDGVGLFTTLVLTLFARWWIRHYPHWIRKWGGLALASGIVVWAYLSTTYMVYLHVHPLILLPHIIPYEKLSFMAVGGLGAIAASALSRIVQRAKDKKDSGPWWKPMGCLFILNVVYSAFVEGWAFDVALPQLPGIHGILSPVWTQPLSDLFLFSAYFFEPAAFFVYYHYLDGLSSEKTADLIRKKLVGFYAKYGWVWFIYVSLAMRCSDAVLGFRLISLGILTWNVAFDSGQYPSSERVLAFLRRHRGLYPLRLFFEGLQAFLEKPWLTGFLRRGISLFFMASIVHDWLPMPSALFEFLTASGLWVAGRYLWQQRHSLSERLSYWMSPRRILIPLTIWVWLFFEVAFAVGSPLSPAAPGPQGHAGLNLLLTMASGALLFAVAHAGKIKITKWKLKLADAWVKKFKSDVIAAATGWKKRDLMTQPGHYVAVLEALAEEVDNVLSVSIPVGRYSEKWPRRAKSLVRLGQLTKGWVDPSVAEGIRLLAEHPGLRKNKAGELEINPYVRHWLLRLENDHDMTLVHVVARTEPKAPRVKIILWNLRKSSPTWLLEALAQYRIGWDRRFNKAHLDVGSLRKVWRKHILMQAWDQDGQEPIKTGLAWVNEISLRTGQFRKGKLDSDPKKLLKWIHFPRILPLVWMLGMALHSPSAFPARPIGASA